LRLHQQLHSISYDFPIGRNTLSSLHNTSSPVQ
jgi:hypothetical protein